MRPSGFRFLAPLALVMGLFWLVPAAFATASFNEDLGFEAVAGTTDGGGNRAKHDGNPAQCIGVRCR